LFKKYVCEEVLREALSFEKDLKERMDIFKEPKKKRVA
jgi:predicted oxidoreductase